MFHEYGHIYKDAFKVLRNRVSIPLTGRMFHELQEFSHTLQIKINVAEVSIPLTGRMFHEYLRSCSNLPILKSQSP